MYHLQMAGLQSEAQLEDLRKEKQKNTELTNTVTELKSLVAKLKSTIQEKDRKIKQLKTEKDDLQFALETLKVKVVLDEKIRHESEVNVKELRDKILEHDKKIKMLQKENRETGTDP